MGAPAHDARPPKNMVWIPGGAFAMGSEDFYPEERPVHTVEVDGFWMDEHPVTVAEFRRFVKATGHVTVAETAPDAAGLPGRGSRPAGAGLAGLHPARAAASASTTSGPGGPGLRPRSGGIPKDPAARLHGRDLHPVTHVAYADALAYAAWAGKELPTEPEWEFAARGGLDGAVVRVGRRVRAAWADDGQHLAGRLPAAQRPARRLRPHVTGRQVPRRTATAWST